MQQGYSAPGQYGMPSPSYAQPPGYEPSPLSKAPPSASAPGDAADDNYQLPPDVTVDKLAVSDDDMMPSAPPLSDVASIPGYDAGIVNNTCLPPPSYDDVIRDSESAERPAIHPMPTISEQQARDALLELCTSKCCYGTKAARTMTINTLQSTSAYHYVLHTFGESRSTEWTFLPYRGEFLDTPMHGQAPLPWEIPAVPMVMFQNETRKLEVPHTSSLSLCFKCHGMGRLRCHHCFGRGHSHCSCHGGTRTVGGERRTCSFCHGSGQRRCTWCSGRGHVRCKVCCGCRQLRWFIQLNIVWTDHNEDFILERTDMPDEKIRKADGEMIFKEELPFVCAVNHCCESSVNAASVELVNKHRALFNTERVLAQRHYIRVVPVTEVQAVWKDKTFTFFVYGLERHLVYTADYPQTCCCGCTLI